MREQTLKTVRNKSQDIPNQSEIISEKYDLESVRKEILSMADFSYREFQIKLLPETNNYTGVRLPSLRKLAKKLARENGSGYLNAALFRKSEEELFEEIMLQGMVIGYMKNDISVIFTYTEMFLPKINNWSICDSFCSGFKHAQNHKEQTWEWLEKFFCSHREFTVRFAIVMLLDYYVEEEYVEKLFAIFNRIQHEGYYVKMAVAWAVSICYIKYPENTMAFLQENQLDNFTYCKALQKIIESRCVSTEKKEVIRWMKRSLH